MRALRGWHAQAVGSEGDACAPEERAGGGGDGGSSGGGGGGGGGGSGGGGGRGGGKAHEPGSVSLALRRMERGLDLTPGLLVAAESPGPREGDEAALEAVLMSGVDTTMSMAQDWSVVDEAADVLPAAYAEEDADSCARGGAAVAHGGGGAAAGAVRMATLAREPSLDEFRGTPAIHVQASLGAAVGGITIVQHFEVNVVPLRAQVMIAWIYELVAFFEPLTSLSAARQRKLQAGAPAAHDRDSLLFGNTPLLTRRTVSGPVAETRVGGGGGGADAVATTAAARGAVGGPGSPGRRRTMAAAPLPAAGAGGARALGLGVSPSRAFLDAGVAPGPHYGAWSELARHDAQERYDAEVESITERDAMRLPLADVAELGSTHQRTEPSEDSVEDGRDSEEPASGEEDGDARGGGGDGGARGRGGSSGSVEDGQGDAGDGREAAATNEALEALVALVGDSDAARKDLLVMTERSNTVICFKYVRMGEILVTASVKGALVWAGLR